MKSPRPPTTSRVAILLCWLPMMTFAIPSYLWDFDPDYSLTLPPLEERPPLSRNATNDPALLKYQILGIVGGYVLTVVILFSLLLTVGRRLRRAAQSSHGTLSMEMVNPGRWMQDPSPVTKNGPVFNHWPNKKTPTESPASSHAPTFDNNVVVSHRAQQELEMERIYDVVFSNETKAPKSISIKEKEVGTPQLHTRQLSDASKRSFSQRRPPQLVTRDAGEPGPTSPRSFVSSVHQHGYQPSANSRYSGQSEASSVRSKSTVASSTVQQKRSSRGKNAKSPRKLNISAPIPINKYPGADKDDEATTPLSPTYPERNERLPSPARPRPITPIQDEFEQQQQDIGLAKPYAREQVDQPRPLPRPAPQRINTNVPPPLPPPPKELSPVSATSSTNQLPFRQYASAASATSLGGSTAAPTSPGATKTTLLSPRRDKFSHTGHPAGFVGMGQPTSAGLISAGLATPYSPYMPFSPMTPVTPRLATKEERRQRQRDMARRVANADEDLVEDEKEMWGEW
ncbi:MAG: hypothetical protein Q9159_000519 [Coniocarpon cinnabarinum]